MNALFWHTCGKQCRLGLVVHLERTTDEGLVDFLRGDQRLEELGQFLAVDEAHVQRRIGLLRRKYMVQH